MNNNNKQRDSELNLMGLLDSFNIIRVVVVWIVGEVGYNDMRESISRVKGSFGELQLIQCLIFFSNSRS